MYQPPQIKPMTLGHLALPQKRVMPNGVNLYCIPGDGKGSVRLDILFDGGYGVQTKPLQAMFTNRMLREGCDGLTANDISYRLDFYGAWIDMYSSQNCNHLTLYSLVKHFCPLLELLEKVVKSPLFPEENLDTVKKNNKSYFMVNSQKVDVLSQRHFEHSLWGEKHPLGHIVVPEDYDAMTREDILQYYNAVYGSANCTIFIGGSVDERMISAIEELFGREEWGAPKLSPSTGISAPESVYGRKSIRVEGALQSSVKIGFMAMDSGDDDFFKFRFLTVLLGGYFGSRLMSNIRERNGYTYHIAAEVDAFGRRNAFMVSSETANEYVEPLIKEVYNEIGALLEKPVSDNEVALVRNYIMGELCREYEGVSAKSEVFINTWLSGESFDSVNQYIKAVSSITSGELLNIAQKYLAREKLIEIVVGATFV